MKIDFVSDVSCPWCAIGLNALEQALDRVAPEIRATLHFQPFELNPQMGPEGQEIVEHLMQKYGIDAAQVAANTEAIRRRGAGRRGATIVGQGAVGARAFGQLAGEWRVLPFVIFTRSNRHHILVCHQQHRIQCRVAARPGKQQAVVADDFQPGLLAKGSGEVAHHPREPAPDQ